MRIFDRFFRKSPKGFNRPIAMRYDHPLVFEAYFKTGDQLFSKECTPLPPLVYHVFLFDRDGVGHEVWVKEGEPKPRYVRGRTYRAYLDAEGSYAWFDGQKQVVRVSDTDEEDKDHEGGDETPCS